MAGAGRCGGRGRRGIGSPGLSRWGKLREPLLGKGSRVPDQQALIFQ